MMSAWHTWLALGAPKDPRRANEKSNKTKVNSHTPTKHMYLPVLQLIKSKTNDKSRDKREEKGKKKEKKT